MTAAPAPVLATPAPVLSTPAPPAVGDPGWPVALAPTEFLAAPAAATIGAATVVATAAAGEGCLAAGATVVGVTVVGVAGTVVVAGGLGGGSAALPKNDSPEGIQPTNAVSPLAVVM